MPNVAIRSFLLNKQIQSSGKDGRLDETQDLLDKITNSDFTAIRFQDKDILDEMTVT